MDQADINNPNSGAPTGAPLPWEWFEFLEPPVDGGRMGEFLGLSTDACARRVWQICVDGQNIPFKYIRYPAGPRVIRRPTLLLLHGMGITIASFRAIAHHLLATHDLLLPDYSGFSLTTSPLPPDASLNAMAAAVWRIADLLSIKTLSLGGNSLGGGLSLLAALAEPRRVERLLLSNPACFPQELPRMYRVIRTPLVGEVFMTLAPAERFVAGVEYVGYADKTRFDPLLRQIYLRSLASRRTRLRLMQLMRALPANGADSTSAPHVARLHTLRVPTLISWGMRDPLLVAGSGERLARLLPGAVLEAYEDLAHMPHEEMPERIGRRWGEFLAEG